MKSTKKTLNKPKGFTSRYGLIVSMIAGSAGLGNVWRFPRMAALHGGGAFVLLWTVFLVLLCLPATISEVVLGRATRHAPPGAFKDFVSKKFTWMGGWLVFSLTAITAYYCAIMGWVLFYFIKAISGQLIGSDSAAMFESVSNGNIYTVLFFAFSVIITAVVIYRGVSKGIEKANKILLPSIVLILIFLAIKCIMLPGGLEGLNRLFTIDPSYYAKSETWLAALSQAAWSVGPGWGFILTYAIYSPKKQDVALTQTAQGFGDNSIALLAGCMVLPALFASVPTTEAALEICASGNYGLTFISMIEIASKIPGGAVLLALFFFALYAAALSSCISMLIGPIQALMDFGWSKKKSVIVATVITLVLGLPSAWSINFLGNQDWVCGIAILIGSLITCFIVYKFGVEKFRQKYLNIPTRDITIGKYFNYGVKYTSPILVFVMMSWYIIDAVKADPTGWWNPFSVYSVGTVVFQLGLWFIILKSFNNKMADSIKTKYFEDNGYPDIPDNLL